MRQLFIPACLCLVTWSAPLGLELPRPAEALAGKSALPNTSHVNAVAPEKPTLTMSASAATASVVPSSSETSLDAQPLVGEQPAPEDQTSIDQIKLTEITPPTGQTPTQKAPDTPESPETAAPATSAPAPAHKPVVHRSRREICNTLAKAAHSNRLPIPFFIRLLFQESRFEAAVVSRAGAQGIAQFMPETAADVGLDNPFDPLQAIPAAARLLRGLADQFGNLGLAAAAYNAGPRRIHEWLQKKGQLPAETRGYVKAITGQAAEDWKAAEPGHGSNRLPQHVPCKDVAGLYAWNGEKRVPLPPRVPAALIAKQKAEMETASADSKKQSEGARKHASHAGKRTAHEAGHRKKTAVQLAARRHGKHASD